ncbi:MAG: O-antigen ligase family protein [Candidatus Zixiibacteriota bacterium]
MKNTKLENILSILLPLVLLYAAIDNGAYQKVPMLGISGLFLVVALLLVISRRSLKLPPKIISIPFAIFVAFIAIGIFWSKSMSGTVEEIAYLAGIFAALFITMQLEEISSKKMHYLILAGATIVMIIGYVYYLMPFLGLLKRSHDMVNYFFATFYWKNPAGGYLSIFFPIIFFVFLFSEKYSIPKLIAFILFAIAFILTRSRGAWLSLFISSVIFIIFILLKKPAIGSKIFKRIKKKWILISLSVIIIAISSVLLIPSDSQRQKVNLADSKSEMPQERSSQERLKMLDMGFRIIKDHPMGIGAGAFLIVYPRYLESSYYLSKHLHNQYIQYTVETGIIGGIAFFMMLLGIVLIFYKNLDSDKDEFYMGIVIGATALFLHLGLDFDWTFAGISFPLFTLIGLNLRQSKNYIAIKKNLFKFILIFIFGIFALLCFLNVFAENSFENAQLDNQNYVFNMQKAVKFAPWNALYRYYLGNHYLEMGKSKKAEDYIEKAYNMQTEMAQANYILGQIKYNKGQVDQGIGLIKKSIELAPFSAPENQLRLAKILISRNNIEEAKKYLEHLTSSFSSDPSTQYTAKSYSYRYYVGRAHLELARILRDQGNMQKAHQEHFKAMQLLRPRKNDRIAKKLGFDTYAPEWVAVSDFEDQIKDSTLTRVTGINEVYYDFWKAKSLVKFYYIHREDASDSFKEYEARYKLIFEDSTWQISN